MVKFFYNIKYPFLQHLLEILTETEMIDNEIHVNKIIFLTELNNAWIQGHKERYRTRQLL